MHPRHYRLRFLLDVARTLVLPQLLFNVAMYACNLKLGVFIRALLSVLCIPLAGTLRALYTARKDRLAAGKHFDERFRIADSCVPQPH